MFRPTSIGEEIGYTLMVYLLLIFTAVANHSNMDYKLGIVFFLLIFFFVNINSVKTFHSTWSLVI